MTISRVYPIQIQINGINESESKKNLNPVLQSRICNVVQVVIFVVALASVTNVLFLAHNTKSSNFNLL